MSELDPRQRYFDDFEVGEVFELGSAEVSEAEIVAFGRSFDPQPFHVDREAARSSIFGGLVASGWHTAAMAMRLFVDGFVSGHSLGSPGVDELRFTAPVRPGARLHLRVTIVDMVPSRSKPDRGLLRQRQELFDVSGPEPCLVLSMVTMGLWRRRPERSLT